MLILPRNIQALACCAGACLQSFCTWGNFNRRKWGFFNRRKLGNIQPAELGSIRPAVTAFMGGAVFAPQQHQRHAGPAQLVPLPVALAFQPASGRGSAAGSPWPWRRE